MRNFFGWMAVWACILFAGCQTRDSVPPAPTTINTKPLTDADKAVEAARKEKEAAQAAQFAEQAKKLSRASANVRGAVFANQHNPDGAPKEAVNTLGTEASKDLPVPFAEDDAVAMKLANAILTGNLTEARSVLSDTQKARDAGLARELALSTKVADLNEKLVASEQAKVAAVAKAQAESDARVSAYKEQADAQIRIANAAADQLRRDKDRDDKNRAQEKLEDRCITAGSVIGGLALLAFIAAYCMKNMHVAGLGGALTGMAVAVVSFPQVAQDPVYRIISLVLFSLLLVGTFVIGAFAFLSKKKKDEVDAGNAMLAHAWTESAPAVVKLLSGPTAGDVAGVLGVALGNRSKSQLADFLTANNIPVPDVLKPSA